MALLPDICDNLSVQSLLIAYLYRCIHALVIFVRVYINTASTYGLTLIFSNHFGRMRAPSPSGKASTTVKPPPLLLCNHPKPSSNNPPFPSLFQHLFFFVHTSHATGKTHTDNPCLYWCSQGHGSTSRREASGAN